MVCISNLYISNSLSARSFNTSPETTGCVSSLLLLLLLLLRWCPRQDSLAEEFGTATAAKVRESVVNTGQRKGKKNAKATGDHRCDHVI